MWRNHFVMVARVCPPSRTESALVKEIQRSLRQAPPERPPVSCLCRQVSDEVTALFLISDRGPATGLHAHCPTGAACIVHSSGAYELSSEMPDLARLESALTVARYPLSKAYDALAETIGKCLLHRSVVTAVATVKTVFQPATIWPSTGPQQAVSDA